MTNTVFSEMLFLEQGNINAAALYNENLIIQELLAIGVVDQEIANASGATTLYKMYLINAGVDVNKLAILINTGTVKLINPIEGYCVYNTSLDTKFRYNGTTWEVENGFRTLSFTTGSLADQASEDIDLPENLTIVSITADQDSVLRVYFSSTDRTSDTAPLTPELNTNKIQQFDVPSVAGFETIIPQQLASTGDLVGRIYNNSGSPNIINFTITYLI